MAPYEARRGASPPFRSLPPRESEGASTAPSEASPRKRLRRQSRRSNNAGTSHGVFSGGPPGRSASRRTARGWGPAVRGEQSGKPSRRTARGWGPAVRGEQSGKPSRRTARGWGPAVRGEQSGKPSRRTARGWGPAVRGEHSEACAGNAGARMSISSRKLFSDRHSPRHASGLPRPQDVTAEQRLHQGDRSEGHGEHEQPEDRDGAEMPLLLQIEDNHRYDLGIGREQDDRGRQLANHPDEDEAPRRDDPAPGERRGDPSEDAETARAQDPSRLFQLGMDAAKRGVGLGVAHWHLLGEIGDEEDPERAVEEKGGPRVGDEERDGQDHARDDDGRESEEGQELVARDDLAVADVGQQRGQPRAREGREESQLEGVDDGGLGGVLEERERPVREREVVPRERLGPRAREGGLGQDAVGKKDRA